MSKSIALIGGAGFIGTNLANFFLSIGYRVLIIDRHPVDKKKIISTKIDQKLIDVNITSDLIEALKENENVIWLVSDLIPSVSMDNLVDDFIFNINPLIKFLEYAKNLKQLKCFVFISSGGTVYGNSINNISFKENSPNNPVSAYGLSKLISENYIEFITRKSHFMSYILRPSNVYGCFQNLIKPQGIIGFAFKAIIEQKPIELYNGGMMVRDFIHVLDFAEAIKLCLETTLEKSKIEIYNIGSSNGHSIIDILNLVNEISGAQIKIIDKPAREIDCNFSILDTDKIRNRLNWQSRININEGLTSVWNWIRTEKLEI